MHEQCLFNFQDYINWERYVCIQSMFTFRRIDTESNCEMDIKETIAGLMAHFLVLIWLFPFALHISCLYHRHPLQMLWPWHHCFQMVYDLLINQDHINIPSEQSVLPVYESPILTTCCKICEGAVNLFLFKKIGRQLDDK